MIRVIGIDWSITSPAWTVLNPETQEFRTFWFPQIKRHWQINHENLRPLKYPVWVTAEERYSVLATLFRNSLTYIDKSVELSFLLEGYAFAGKGKVFNIAESTGALKQVIWNLIWEEVPTIAITSWKKQLGVGGNAKKKQVVDFFIDSTGIDLYTLFNINPEAKDLGIITDIADSWGVAVCKMNQLKSEVHDED